MYHRILAFFITENKDTAPYTRAVKHLRDLAESFSKKTTVMEIGKYFVHLAYEGEIEELLIKADGEIRFCVGPRKSRGKNGWNFWTQGRSDIHDVFLAISFAEYKITVTNDSVGTLPVYYSTRNGLCLSNIEPVVVLASDSSYCDLSHESVYELLRYSMLLGTNTLYNHVRNQEPDATYIYCGKNDPEKKYNNTLYPDQSVANKKDSDIVSEFIELNRFSVHEALSDEEDIIMPLSSGYDSRMLLAAALEDKEIKERLRCYTYKPNMSLETRPAEKLCRIAGVEWKKVQLPEDSFSTEHLKQILHIFGSTLNVHGKYQIDFLSQIENEFMPGRSVMMTGYMTGVALAPSALFDLVLCDSKVRIADAMGGQTIYSYLPDDYLKENSRVLDPEMRYHVEPELNSLLGRCKGESFSRVSLFIAWTRQRNFGSYYPRIMDWKIPHLNPHFNSGFMNFSLGVPHRLLKNKKMIEMALSKYYPELSRVASNSNLTVKNILKRSIANPVDGITYYLPLLVKYYFKQPWMLSGKLIAEMEDPVLPNLQSIGKAGVYPLFGLNSESRDVFNDFFDLKEVDELFLRAMSGDKLSCKRLTILEPLAYALKMLEK